MRKLTTPMEWAYMSKEEREAVGTKTFIKKFPQGIVFLDEEEQTQYAQQVVKTDQWWALGYCTSPEAKNIYLTKKLGGDK